MFTLYVIIAWQYWLGNSQAQKFLLVNCKLFHQVAMKFLKPSILWNFLHDFVIFRQV